MEKEIWKDIEGFEGLYQVSNIGRVKSSERITTAGRGNKERVKKEAFLKPKANSGGYANVVLSKDGSKKNHSVHRLVANAFIKNEGNKKEVNHIDGNKMNNRIENLEWCTRSENTYHALNTGLQKPFSKKIDQFDKEGNFIKSFDSLTIAAKEVGISLKTISGNLRGKPKTAGGFVWKYSVKKEG